MRCTNCGNEINENLKFCTSCGAKIEPVLENNTATYTNTVTTQNTCKNCGSALKPNAQFCTSCGTSIGNDSGVNYAYNQQQVNRQNVANNQMPNNNGQNKTLINTLIVLVVVLIVLILGMLAYKMISSDKEDTPIPTPDVVNVTVNPFIDETPAPEPEPKETSYVVVKKDITWYQAKEEAEDKGGTLICINNEAEFVKACSLAEKANITVFWVGAKRTSEDLWSDTKWLDGRYISYTNWLEGEPTYYSEDYEEENFLMVFKVNNKWYYNDSINDVSKYYKGKIGYIAEIEE